MVIDNQVTITKIKPIASLIKSKVLNSFGHVKRSTQGVCKECLEGKKSGRRSKRRKPRYCLDSIHLWSEMTLYH